MSAQDPPPGQPKLRNSRLRFLTLLSATYFMVSGGPYGIEDVVGYGGYFPALVLIFLLPFFWSFPTALMLGELSAAIPEEGGFYAWARKAIGPFWGFQVAWLSLAGSAFDMAIYPTTFILYLGRLLPSATAGHRGVVLELVAIAGAILWNLGGAASVGEGSLKLWAISIFPFWVLTILGGLAGLAGGLDRFAVCTPITQHHGMRFSTAVMVAMWSYMGWDNATTVAREVENPQRNYPRVMLLAVVVIMCTYAIPVSAMAWAGIPARSFSTGAWVDAARALGGPVLAVAILVAGAVDGFCTFANLALSYTRLPVALATDRLLPSSFTKRLRNGSPWVAIVVCGLGWAVTLSFTFERLITIDLALWGISMIIEFIALFMLRKRQPCLWRPFRIPGPDWITILLGLSPTVLVIYALFSAYFEHVGGTSAFTFSILIAASGLPLYALAAKSKKRSCAQS